jgi:hypothetical protein
VRPFRDRSDGLSHCIRVSGRALAKLAIISNELSEKRFHFGGCQLRQ